MSTKFFNNTPANTLFEKLKGIANGMSGFNRFLAVVGYFSSSGYFKLRKELGDISDIRILIGINADDIFRKHNLGWEMLEAPERAKDFYNEQCRLYEDGKEVGLIPSSKENKKPPVWMRISSIYYKLYGGSDLTFDSKVKKLINLRNKYIHPKDGSKPVITSENFIELFETMVEYLSVFK